MEAPLELRMEALEQFEDGFEMEREQTASQGREDLV